MTRSPAILKELVVALALLLAAIPSLAEAAGYYYTVQKNDTMTVIARRHNLSTAQLSSANRLRYDASLVPGSRIWVPADPPKASTAPRIAPRQPVRTTQTSAAPKTFSPQKSKPEPPAPAPQPSRSTSSLHVVRSGDTLWGIANKNGLSVSQLSAINGIDPGSPLEVGQVLRLNGEAIQEIPGGGIDTPSIATRPAPKPEVGSLRPSSRGFIWPVEGQLLRRFVKNSQELFTGLDIGTPKESEIRAARDGKVAYAGGVIPSYGRMVIIQHDGGLATCYGQLSRSLVREGQQVRQGQVIARSGENGRGEALLHFEIRKDGEAVNPEPYLP